MKKNQPVSAETKKEIRKLAKRVNDSLYRLEKRGMAKTSSIHKSISRKASIDTSGKYSRSGSNPRVSGSSKHFKTEAEANRYKRELEKIIASKSRTVTGVKEAKLRRAEKIKETTEKKRQAKAEDIAARKAAGKKVSYDPTDRLREEIRKKAKVINNSLARLENEGIQDRSREYQLIEHYALDKGRGYIKGSDIEKQGKYYNVDLDSGAIRVTTDMSRFETADDLYQYNKVLDNIMNAQTRTVTGTREAMDKAEQAFLESVIHREHPDMTYEQYTNVFEIYRTKVNSDRKDRAGSNKVVQLIRNRNIFDLTDDQIERALKYEFDDTVELQKVKYDEIKGTYVFA